MTSWQLVSFSSRMVWVSMYVNLIKLVIYIIYLQVCMYWGIDRKSNHILGKELALLSHTHTETKMFCSHYSEQLNIWFTNSSFISRCFKYSGEKEQVPGFVLQLVLATQRSSRVSCEMRSDRSQNLDSDSVTLTWYSDAWSLFFAGELRKRKIRRMQERGEKLAVRKEKAPGRGPERNRKVERAVGNHVGRPATRDVSGRLLAVFTHWIVHKV